MQMTYDDTTGAVYVYFQRTQSATTKRVSKHTLIDYDADGNVIGVELLYANEGVDLADLANLPQLPEVERLLTERGWLSPLADEARTMTIYPTVSISPIPNGSAAHAGQFGLAAHAVDPDGAVDRIGRIVGVWVTALARRGDIEAALRRLGVEWDTDGEGVIVRPRVITPSN